MQAVGLPPVITPDRRRALYQARRSEGKIHTLTWVYPPRGRWDRYRAEAHHAPGTMTSSSMTYYYCRPPPAHQPGESPTWVHVGTPCSMHGLRRATPSRTGYVSSLRVVGRQGRGTLGYTVLLISYKSKPNGPPMQKDKQHFFGLGLGGIITFL